MTLLVSAIAKPTMPTPQAPARPPLNLRIPPPVEEPPASPGFQSSI